MVDRDTVDYRDTGSFDDSSLQDVQTIKSAILHKQYGKDVRSALAQLPDSLIKLFGDTGGNSNAEVEEARGGFETLGLHEQAQNAGIDKVTVEVQNARTNSSSQTYQTLKERMDSQENDLNNSINDKLAQISAVPETFANLAALQSKYPTGKTGIFVTADNGHKYIWVNGSWTDSGVYQSVGVADKSIDPIKLKTTSVVNNKSGKTYNVLSGNKDLYILNEPISEAGIVNVTGKFSSGTVYLYLLKKHSDKFIVIEKSVITVTEGWQSIFTNFYAEGGGDEYIGVLGSVYYAYEGGAGFYNYSSADNTSTEFITNQLVANSDFSLFTTIENSKLADVIDKKTNELSSKIPINQFKNGIKDLSKYSVASANTTYIFNDPLKQGNIIVHIKSNKVQNANIYIVKKDNLRFTVLKKINIDLVVGENVIDMEYTSGGSGDEYIASTGVVAYAYKGGFGFYQISQGSTINNEGDVFNADDHTDVTTDFGVYPEYKSDLNKKIEKIYDDLDSITPKLLLTDYTMPKYSEIVDQVGFVGRWFDKTVNGVQTKTTINQGSEFYFKVKNTKTINVNFVLNSDLETPYFAYSIDGSAMTRQLITKSSLPAVTTDEHIVRVVIDGLNEHEDKWKGEKGVSFKNVTVDLGGTVTGVLPKNRKIMFFGDSITEGIRVLSMDANPNGNSATGAWPFIASEQLNSISYRVGFGASGVTTGGSGYVPPLLQNIDSMTASKTTPYYEPDIVVVNIGTNDGKSTSSNFITQFNTTLDRLSIKYSGTPIFVILPFNGAKRSEITTCVNSRSNIYLIDTVKWGVDTTDGVHPNQVGGITAGKKTAEYMISILGKNYFI
ncbi:SGNH/GDSL hydrolase family protein [Leuconostoc mesenteroides]|uniref:SGNH/GDSL hydrolase family protein n=1 Tax=Leuconostoc mesenteroides TaxID=1245 RepID=UPI0020736533|nr:SGNH/GDSL hydrolase family protein [Leuconostoc mesenteroides]MCM6832898.1 SGNH/GDSL hydrolase family protein [Leuconostoc mesenteroides]